jgi:hypothetical protein
MQGSCGRLVHGVKAPSFYCPDVRNVENMVVPPAIWRGGFVTLLHWRRGWRPGIPLNVWWGMWRILLNISLIWTQPSPYADEIPA